MQNKSDQKEHAKTNDLAINKENEDENPIDNTDYDGSEDPGSELDSIREYHKKLDSDKKHSKP